MTEKFCEFEKEIISRGMNVHGVEIVKDGGIVFRRLFHDDAEYPIYSAAKSVTALAAGLLSHEGKLSFDDPIGAYIEENYLAVLSEKQREVFCRLPISRFLTMTVAGFPFRPEGDDWLTFSLLSNEDYAREPQFSYSNISAYLVGIACENAAGMHLGEFIRQRIFEPLSIPLNCTSDPQGRFYGATGMFMRLSELSRMGQLFLNRGEYGGRQIIPESVIGELTRTRVKTKDGGYGYFIWTKPDHYYISGKWGQKCLIYPARSLVITYMADMPDSSDELQYLAEKLAESI